MTLQLRAVASLRVRTGFLSSSVIPLEDVARAFVETTRGTPLVEFAKAIPVKVIDDRQGFEITLHPSAGPVALIPERHGVLFGAITSYGGPGYHAFLTEALDAVQAKLGLKWESRNAMDDETGYIHNRDFPRLQRRMAQFFKTTCQEIIAPQGDRRMGIGTGQLRYTLPELDQDEVLTLLGPRSIEIIQYWATLTEAGSAHAAADFYPWWGEGFGGDFFRGLALSVMWMNLRWAKPLDATERKLMVHVMSWLNDAVGRGCPPPVPIEAVSAILELVVSEAAPDFARAAGIGYRRRQKLVSLDDGWAIRIPGCLRSESEQGGALVFRNAVFSVRVSTGVRSADSDDSVRALAPGEVERGRGFFPADDGEGLQLEAVARTRPPKGEDKLCLMKIWMAEERWRGLAESIADSVHLRAH